MSFIPVNRYILVQKQEVKKEERMVLVPADYKPIGDEYIKVKVLAVSLVGHISIDPGDDLVVRQAFIEEFSLEGETFYLVLENHVVGIIKNEENFE